MRFAGVVLGWLIATLALAVAVPAGWVQLHVVDADGYAALARRPPPTRPCNPPWQPNSPRGQWL